MRRKVQKDVRRQNKHRPENKQLTDPQVTSDTFHFICGASREDCRRKNYVFGTKNKKKQQIPTTYMNRNYLLKVRKCRI